jgi:transposase
MATRYTDEFRRDAVRFPTTSGLTQPQAASYLGVGLSTLNKWAQKHQHDNLKLYRVVIVRGGFARSASGSAAMWLFWRIPRTNAEHVRWQHHPRAGSL